MAMMAITTTTATVDGGGARLEIQVYFYLEHYWGLQGAMSTRGSQTTSKSHRCVPCYATSSMGALLPGTSFLHSREGVSLRSASAVFRRRERGGL